MDFNFLQQQQITDNHLQYTIKNNQQYHNNKFAIVSTGKITHLIGAYEFEGKYYSSLVCGKQHEGMAINFIEPLTTENYQKVTCKTCQKFIQRALVK